MITGISDSDGVCVGGGGWGCIHRTSANDIDPTVPNQTESLHWHLLVDASINYVLTEERQMHWNRISPKTNLLLYFQMYRSKSVVQ